MNWEAFIMGFGLGLIVGVGLGLLYAYLLQRIDNE